MHIGTSNDSLNLLYSGRISALKNKMASHATAGGVYQTYQMRQMART